MVNRHTPTPRRQATSRRTVRYASLLSAEDGGRQETPPGGRRDGLRSVRPGMSSALIAVALLVAIAAGGVVLWLRRPVNVTVNGEVEQVPINTTVAQACERLGLANAPGNLVSVGGSVLQEGAGEPYSVIVDGRGVSLADAAGWQLRGDEQIEFGTGADVLEEYSVEVRETPPRLQVDGGLGPISYVAQWGKVRLQEVRTGAISGEMADGDVLDEGQDCVVRTTTPDPEGDEQLVALTFDDGPSAYTQAYLDILARYGAHATFFNLGVGQESFPEAARAIVSSGNEIMSHTNQHVQLTTLDEAAMLAEITSAAATIERVSGVKTTSIRPPYGDFDAQCWLWSQGEVSLSVLWTQDSEDWRRQGVDAIVENALAGVTSGSIILMHDGGGDRDMDVAALPAIIERLQADGYRLVTLGELLASCPDIPVEVASGYAPMPEDAAWPTELA